jgi:hypothetical protein
MKDALFGFNVMAVQNNTSQPQTCGYAGTCQESSTSALIGLLPVLGMGSLVLTLWLELIRDGYLVGTLTPSIAQSSTNSTNGSAKHTRRALGASIQGDRLTIASTKRDGSCQETMKSPTGMTNQFLLSSPSEKLLVSKREQRMGAVRCSISGIRLAIIPRMSVQFAEFPAFAMAA